MPRAAGFAVDSRLTVICGLVRTHGDIRTARGTLDGCSIGPPGWCWLRLENSVFRRACLTYMLEMPAGLSGWVMLFHMNTSNFSSLQILEWRRARGGGAALWQTGTNINI